MNSQSAITVANKEMNDFAPGIGLLTITTLLIRRLVSKLRMMEQVRAERNQLADLDPELLRDIGIDDVAARSEAARSVFDLPQSRL